MLDIFSPIFLSMTHNNMSKITLWTFRGSAVHCLRTIAVPLIVNCTSPLGHHQGNRNGLSALA